MGKWIDKKERMPQEKDADKQSCVIVWHKYQGAMVTGWMRARDSEFITHWMPTPEGPDKG